MAAIPAIVVAAGVALAGKQIADARRNPAPVSAPNPALRQHPDASMTPTAMTQFTSHGTKDAQRALFTRAGDFWNAANGPVAMGGGPINTGIVPANYNTLNSFDQDFAEYTAEQGSQGPVAVVDPGQTMLPQGAGFVSPQEMQARATQIYNSTMFQNPVEGFDRSDAIRAQAGPHVEAFSDLSGLPYTPVHNNMVPFYRGSGPKQNVDPMVYAHKLETFTGRGELLSQPKRELAPMFAPMPQNIYGMPALPDEYRTERLWVSDMKQGVLPVPKVQVAAPKPEEMPRLDYRTIDQMRTLSNPQVSYAGRALAPATDPVPHRPQDAPAVVKRRAPKEYDLGARGFGPATASVSANLTAQDYATALRMTQRGAGARAESGPAFFDAAPGGPGRWTYGPGTDCAADKALGIDSTVREPFRESYTNDYMRNLAYEGHFVGDYGASSFAPRMQEREDTQFTGIDRNLAGDNHLHLAAQYLQDKPRVTNRMTRKTFKNGNVVPVNRYKGSYATKKANMTARPTHRQTTQNTDYMGAAGPGTQGGSVDRTAYEYGTQIRGLKEDALVGWTGTAGRGGVNVPLDQSHMTMTAREKLSGIERNRPLPKTRQPVISIPDAFETQNFTRPLNKLPEVNPQPRYDASILTQLDDNPFAIKRTC